MVKKLVLIGPPGVGKTTIKKVIFEGQNADLLLKTPLEPTRGNELTIVEFEWEKIAINDLSGQELERWLTKEPEVFNNADLVLIFLDVSSKWETQIEFVKELFDLLIKWAPGANVTVYLHKTDLISPEVQDQLVNKMIEFQRKSPINFNFHFTSIVGKFFPKFLDIFFEGMFKFHVPDDRQGQFIQDSIRQVYQILNNLYQKGKMSENYLLIQNNLNPDTYKPFKEVLLKLHFIGVSDTIEDKSVQLLKKGQDFYNFLKNYFEIVPDSQTRQPKADKSLGRHGVNESVLGLIITDDIGRDLCIVETSEVQLQQILNVKNTQSDGMVSFVSMFLSALFALNPIIVLSNLQQILIKGITIDYFIIQKNAYMFIFFINPEIPVTSLKEPLNTLTNLIIERNHDIFSTFKQNGAILQSIEDLKDFLRSKIQDINGITKRQTKKFVFDEIHAKELFLTLDEISQNPNIRFDQVKNLKKRLVGAILNKNFHDLHAVELKIVNLRKKTSG